MKKICKTKVTVETREVLMTWNAAQENITEKHFDVCPLCHSPLAEPLAVSVDSANSLQIIEKNVEEEQ
jgi:hypothetical protein